MTTLKRKNRTSTGDSCSHQWWARCDNCEGRIRLTIERATFDLFDTYEEHEDDEYIPGLSYKLDDASVYDGRSKERSQDFLYNRKKHIGL